MDSVFTKSYYEGVAEKWLEEHIGIFPAAFTGKAGRVPYAHEVFSLARLLEEMANRVESIHRYERNIFIDIQNNLNALAIVAKYPELKEVSDTIIETTKKLINEIAPQK